MTDIISLRTFCLSLPYATEDTPFGPDIIVFRICGKMFALLFLGEGEAHISFKSDPDWAVYLRDTYPEITGAYHMNKKYWSQFSLPCYLSVSLIEGLIKHSYYSVAKGLSRKIRLEYPLVDSIVQLPEYDL